LVGSRKIEPAGKFGNAISFQGSLTTEYSATVVFRPHTRSVYLPKLPRVGRSPLPSGKD